MSFIVETAAVQTKRLWLSFLKNWMNFVSYLGVFIVSILGCTWVHRLTPNDLRYPWRVVDSDLSSVYSLAQALGQSWTGLIHQSLGAPSTADLSLAFIPDDLHIEIMRVLVHLTNNPFIAVNLFYILTFGLCAVSFLFLADELKISRWASLPLSLSYSWLPYHFTRMDAGHVFLAAYYMIPVGVVILHRLFLYAKGSEGVSLPTSVSKKILLFLAVIAVGSSGAYYAVFFSLLTFTLVVLLPRGTTRRVLATKSLVISAVGIGFLLAPLLRTIWARAHGLHTVLTRSPEESIQFGGTLGRLLVPWGVWLPENLKPLVAPMEFEWNAVPLIGSVGVWLILISIARAISGSSETTSNPESSVRFFFLGALLFYLASGLSLIFAYGVDSSFRTWNRMSIILLTFSLLMVGFLLSKITVFTKMASAFLILIVIITQLTPLKNSGIGSEPDPVSVTAFKELTDFAQEVQRKAPRGCAILQLPIMEYPEGGQIDGVGNGEHLWLPLLTEGFRWSYGAPKGSAPGDYWSKFIGASPELSMKQAADLGFCAAVSFSNDVYTFKMLS
jgi:hypothetical protein